MSIACERKLKKKSEAGPSEAPLVAAKHFLSWVERQAQSLRRRLLLAPLAQLDPFQLATNMGAQVLSPTDVPGLDSNCLNRLLVADSDGWSAGSVRFPDGQIVIVLNPNHPATRKHATLMEELSHIYLKHTPTQLIIIDGVPAFRSFKKAQETEAYWVGAAALLPRNVLEFARANRIDRSSLALRYGVSEALVKFRERVTSVTLN
jgi:hypothetical protein